MVMKRHLNFQHKLKCIPDTKSGLEFTEEVRSVHCQTCLQSEKGTRPLSLDTWATHLCSEFFYMPPEETCNTEKDRSVGPSCVTFLAKGIFTFK